MHTPFDPAAAYRRVDFESYVLGCDGAELVRLCLDEVDAALARSIWADRHARPDLRRKSLERAQMCLLTLTSGIDASSPLARPLETFYRSLALRVAGCLGRFDARTIEEARADIREVASSFDLAR